MPAYMGFSVKAAIPRLAVIAVLASVSRPCEIRVLAQEAVRFVGTDIDQDGHRLTIMTSDGRRIVPSPEKDQVGFEKVAISKDGESVGWLALFGNCCTSYPIPRKLIVMRRGASHAFAGIELPVWRWTFLDEGGQVAFQQETVHGGLGAHYELRDVTTGRLIGECTPGASREGCEATWVDAADAIR